LKAVVDEKVRGSAEIYWCLAVIGVLTDVSAITSIFVDAFVLKKFDTPERVALNILAKDEVATGYSAKEELILLFLTSETLPFLLLKLLFGWPTLPSLGDYWNPCYSFLLEELLSCYFDFGLMQF